MYKHLRPFQSVPPLSVLLTFVLQNSRRGEFLRQSHEQNQASGLHAEASVDVDKNELMSICICNL